MQEQNSQDKQEKITPGDLSFSAKKEAPESTAEEETQKSPLRLKIENFIYYYKWHTLAALFVIFVIVVCTLQTCNKTSADCYILYAGAQNISKTASDGDISEYQTCLSSLRLYAEDTDGDGNTVVSMETLYLLSPEEREEVEANLQDGYSLNESQLQENAESLADCMITGDTYLCLLSEYWLNQYEGYFTDITGYLADGDTSKELTASGKGVYLSSTSLGKKPGFDSLPEDTVICLRAIGFAGGKQGKQNFENAENMLRAILK